MITTQFIFQKETVLLENSKKFIVSFADVFDEITVEETKLINYCIKEGWIEPIDGRTFYKEKDSNKFYVEYQSKDIESQQKFLDCVLNAEVYKRIIEKAKEHGLRFYHKKIND